MRRGPPKGIQFLSATHGWIWSDGSIEATTDGGRSWRRIASGSSGASSTLGSISFVTEDIGFGVITNGAGQSATFIETVDAGRTWRIVAGFPHAHGSPSSGGAVATGTVDDVSWTSTTRGGAGPELQVKTSGEATASGAGIAAPPGDGATVLAVASLPLSNGSGMMLVFGLVGKGVSSVISSGPTRSRSCVGFQATRSTRASWS